MLPTRCPSPPARGCPALPYALSCVARERLPCALPVTRTRASPALPYALPCAACTRLACAAAAAKLLLPLASSVPCPAVGCCTAAALLLPPALLLLLVTRDDVSLFEHTSGSLQAPKAPADAGEEVRTQFHAAHIAYKRWMARDAAATLAVRVHLSFDQRANFRQVPSAHAMYSAVGGRIGAGGSGGGGHQELEPSCVAACAPTNTVYAHPSTVLSCLVVPSASSGSTEGGDPTAAETVTSRRLPRLETPPGFAPRMSSPPLRPVAADFGGPAVVGGGDAGDAGSGGAASGIARSPLVGGVGGTGAGGAGTGGALQSLPRQPIFLEQPSLSLPEPMPTCTTPPLLFPPPYFPLPAPARYVPLSVSLTRRREPVSCAVSPAPSRVTREPVVLPLPPPSSLPAVPDPVSDLALAARPTIPCCIAALVTAPASSPAAACALVAELAGFATTCRCAYLAGLVSASSCPPSVRGELVLGYDVLEEYLPYPLSIPTRYVAPGRHHLAHWRAARRVLRYLVGLASRT
ncbi:unnamed protein product [Closterium sp. NIES-53]